MPDKAHKMSDEEARWQAESDLRTLIDAEKIRKDPKRRRAAMKMAREQQKSLKQVQGAHA